MSRGRISPKALIWFGSVIGLALLIILMSRAILREQNVDCELCLSFKGQEHCSRAVGPTEREALDAALQNACTILASGVTETLGCQRTPPSKTSCTHAK